MKSEDLDISVIIPCHNAEPYLAQTVGSVLDQTQAPGQVIIVDDRSTDRSLSIARSLESATKGRVQVYPEHFGSASRTRNFGASRATGNNALMFLDADDVLAPDALESMARELAGGSGGIVACPWRRLVFTEDRWVSRPASCAPRKPGQDALSAWMTGWYYPPCSVLWSRDAFVRVGGWDEEAALNDDGDLMMRALASGVSLIETDSGTAYYRRLPQGETSLSGQRQTYGGLTGRIAVMEKLARLLEEQGRLNSYRAPISRAFALIAADAAGQFTGLSHHAQAKKKHYAPSVWARAINRACAVERSAGTKPTAPPARNKPEEIRFGIDVAEKLLGSVPESGDFADATLEPAAGRPTVSVVIPVYNRAHLLPRTVAGILKQTFTDFEVLIVDDCSTDDIASVVSEFKDPRVRYLRQPKNQGVAAARNRGMREARAPFIAFLDDDDEWFPQKLELQIELFRHSPPDIGLIYTGVETVSDDGARTLDIPSARGDLYQELLVRNILHGAPASAMIRRNVITNVGFFDEELPAIEDYDYWLRVCRSYKVECISTPLVRYNDFRSPVEGKENQLRRSLNIKANLDARAQFYRKHGAEMRRAGVAHLFLVTSARRSLVPEWNDIAGARRLALKAFFLAPTSWAVRDIMLKAFNPPKLLRVMGRRGRQMLTHGHGVKAK